MAYTTINKSTDYFRTKLYTGNGSQDRAITFDESTNMQPDWLWIKSRGSGQSHAIFDAVRGANKRITTNGNGGESTENTNLDSFDTNGFTIDNEAIVNENGIGYVGWNWKAGGGQGSSNTDGTINTTYTSVNTTAGFSISSYTGTGSDSTVGHGLGVTPNIVFFKRLDSSANWVVQTPLLGNKVQLVLNDSSAENTDSRLGASDNWSNQVFTVGTYGDMNASGGTYVAYAFAEKTGYSKFGSYTGNGSTDGTFVYTGFKPAWVMWKKRQTENWGVSDSKRDTFNVLNNKLRPDEGQTESTSNTHMDFLSNGFKFRSSSGEFNGSGGTYIFMAFAEAPLVGSNNVPATAR